MTAWDAQASSVRLRSNALKIKFCSLDAFGAGFDTAHHAVYPHRHPVKVGPEHPSGHRRALFPLAAGHTRVVRVLAPRVGFFVTNLALIGHKGYTIAHDRRTFH